MLWCGCDAGTACTLGENVDEVCSSVWCGVFEVEFSTEHASDESVDCSALDFGLDSVGGDFGAEVDQVVDGGSAWNGLHSLEADAVFVDQAVHGGEITGEVGVGLENLADSQVLFFQFLGFFFALDFLAEVDIDQGSEELLSE